jgi:hypothetical protein
MKCKICNKKLTGKQTMFCSRKCHNKDSNTRNQTYELQQERGKKRKLELIAQAGGSCTICGYKKNYSALVFHHLDPKMKDMKLDLRSLSNNSMKVIQAELVKCQLLCHNCHSETHHPDCALYQLS